jgi:CDP-glycerol glycerophosphotransferase (TagB/SpsB family)
MRKPFSTELDLVKLESSLFFKNVIEILLNTDAKLLLHPNYQSSYELFEKVVGSARVYKNVNYYEIINQSSGVITDYSSIAFDFMYLNKPVYFYDLQQDFNQHIHRPNLILGVDTPGELITSVNQITYNPTNNDIFINHENHCQKIVEYLKNI